MVKGGEIGDFGGGEQGLVFGDHEPANSLTPPPNIAPIPVHSVGAQRAGSGWSSRGGLTEYAGGWRNELPPPFQRVVEGTTLAGREDLEPEDPAAVLGGRCSMLPCECQLSARAAPLRSLGAALLAERVWGGRQSSGQIQEPPEAPCTLTARGRRRASRRRWVRPVAQRPHMPSTQRVFQTHDELVDPCCLCTSHAELEGGRPRAPRPP